ncbi:MAG TPA: ribosome silencing factor [Thermoanaerobaculia bacterium]|nr:ribosome silencing factor [Thermoanaerobaculia bacterium]
MTADHTSQEKVREGLTAALDRKASAVLVFNLTELTTMADYFVLSTASSDRQARAIADAITERLGPALSVEGLQTANWVLMDYGDVVFHIFQEEARRFYALERLWGDAENETGRFAASS